MNDPGRQMGLLHIYTGDGKGKTTAAIGLAARAHGAGLRVLVLQFLKGRDSGEREPLRALGIDLWTATSEKFVFQMNEQEGAVCAAEQLTLFDKMVKAAHSGAYDMIVLDEVAGAMWTGMLPEKSVREFLESRPSGVEIVMTGRDFPPDCVVLADYVSEIRGVKHPFERGISARRGIEY